MSNATERPIITSEGLCYLTACASNLQAPHEVEAMVRSFKEAGTKRGWMLCEDTHFATGQTNPCPCDREPDSRTHYLFAC